jgi:hypothetical protein
MTRLHKFRRDADHKLQVPSTLRRSGMSAGHVSISTSVGPAFFAGGPPLAGKSNPKHPANRTASEIVEKVLHLRKTYRPEPIRIVWFWRAITPSPSRVRVSHSLALWSRPAAGGTSVRKIHSAISETVPGHQI